ncbi:MAG: glycosyltransferase family 2 protein [Armatimonadota bacterium]
MKPDLPLVSVIIPTYNRAEVVTRAIDSVLAQVYEPIEIVVIDDGSTDETRQAVAAYENRVEYRYGANRERGAARNAGLEATSADLVAFLDSDDEMLPGHLDSLVGALIDRPDVGIAYSRAEFFDDGSGEPFDVFPRSPVEGDAFLECAIANRMTIGSVIVRRALLDRVGWFDEDRELAGMEDWELWTRCLGASAVVFIPSVTVRIHFHSRNTVGNPSAMERAIRSAARKIWEHPLNRPRLIPHRRRLSAAQWSLIAHHHMLAGDGRTARARLWEGARGDPLIALSPAWLSMGVKAAAGTRVVAALRRFRRSLHLRRVAATDVAQKRTGL